ncbi:YsnF/AvaK domain-containing protein [Microvirga sp. HBU67558]|uniref:YsnF/AvaK domain-containing protein n=1 Tax=Microvirga TaxID=186650 RepID=UPI001B3977B5|nr:MULTISPECIES: YsnF/AvaK domain-containing protein [unclassified Microvirga]MBQ0819810.1 YsnF/AvaK domain-containing protein [Microvirga sp. HBU67558]
MTKTVTCLYRDRSTADAVVSRLEQAGIARGVIDVYSDDSADLIGDLEDAGVPRSDAYAYAEGVRRGNSLVAVECGDGETDRVVSILDSEDVLDLDERQAAWRSEGWQGYDASGAGSTGGLAGASDMSRTRTGTADTAGRDEVIPVAEEELHVGKREVNRGRVRLHSRVIERPVQEQVTLREERVAVERRPVSGATQAGTIAGDPFQERTIEVEERAEEAVVSKEARVVEEVVVRKQADQRTETISDTVRKTEVDVEDERNVRGTGTTGSSNRTR